MRWFRSFTASWPAKVSAIIVCLALGALAYYGIESGLTKWFKRPSDVNRTLIASSKIVHVKPLKYEDGANIGSSLGPAKGRAVFNLINNSDKIIKIKESSSTCSCVASSGIVGSSVAPGKTLPITYEVTLPEYGHSLTEVSISHDGDHSPIVLQITAEGRRSVPVLKGLQNSSVTFVDLKSTAEYSDLSVVAIEKADSEPWVTAVECDVEGSKITSVGMEESPLPSRDIVERKYRYRLNWVKLPAGPYFSGGLSCTTRSGNKRTRSLGRIYGNLYETIQFTPTALHLDNSDARQEVVIFKRGSGKWSVPSDFQKPPWLSLEWEMSGDVTKLTVTLLQDPPEGVQVMAIPIMNDRGVKSSIRLSVKSAKANADNR